MKRLILALCLAISGAALTAQETSGKARVDFTPVKIDQGIVKIDSPTISEGGQVRIPTWFKVETQPFCKIFQSGVIKDTPQKVELSFIPSESGDVKIFFRAGDYRNKATKKREDVWMKISNITIEGATAPELKMPATGKKVKGWYLARKAEILSDNTVRVSHDSFASTSQLKVVKGQKVTISFDAQFDGHDAK